jgi:hypothetical protein
VDHGEVFEVEDFSLAAVGQRYESPCMDDLVPVWLGAFELLSRLEMGGCTRARWDGGGAVCPSRDAVGQRGMEWLVDV